MHRTSFACAIVIFCGHKMTFADGKSGHLLRKTNYNLSAYNNCTTRTTHLSDIYCKSGFFANKICSDEFRSCVAFGANAFMRKHCTCIVCAISRIETDGDGIWIYLRLHQRPLLVNSRHTCVFVCATVYWASIVSVWPRLVPFCPVVVCVHIISPISIFMTHKSDRMNHLQLMTLNIALTEPKTRNEMAVRHLYRRKTIISCTNAVPVKAGSNV